MQAEFTLAARSRGYYRRSSRPPGWDGTTLERVPDQMQGAREEVILGVATTDVNDGSIPELFFEEVDKAPAGVIVQRIERFVNHNPARLVQHESRKDEVLLLILAEFPVPACDPVE